MCVCVCVFDSLATSQVICKAAFPKATGVTVGQRERESERARQILRNTFSLVNKRFRVGVCVSVRFCVCVYTHTEEREETVNML